MTKVALITGASSGIGMDLAEEFASDKKDLVLVARREDRLKKLADRLSRIYGIKVYNIFQDLSEPGAAVSIINKIESKGLKIHTLVNNAGTQVYGKHQDTDLSAEMAMIQINLIALTELTKLSIKHMKSLEEGHILNVGSTGSFAPGPFDAIYQATKAYVLFYSEGIAVDLKGTGINVSVLCPGATKSEFSTKANMNDVFIFKYMAMSSKKVAKAGYRGMLRRQRVIVPGLINKLIVFSVRVFPRTFMTNMAGILLS